MNLQDVLNNSEPAITEALAERLADDPTVQLKLDEVGNEVEAVKKPEHFEAYTLIYLE